jgi:hypothetical protein
MLFIRNARLTTFVTGTALISGFAQVSRRCPRQAYFQHVWKHAVFLVSHNTLVELFWASQSSFLRPTSLQGISRPAHSSSQLEHGEKTLFRVFAMSVATPMKSGKGVGAE